MTNESNPNLPPAQTHETAPDQNPDRKPISPGKALAGLALALIVLACLAGYGILRRRQAESVLADTTSELAAPTVIVAAPKPGAPAAPPAPVTKKQ